MLNISHKLINLRNNLKYSQQFVADKLNIDVLEYMGYENCRTIPKFEHLKILASLYRVRVEDLLIEDTVLDIKKKNIDLNTNNINFFIKERRKNKIIKNISNHKFLYSFLISLIVMVVILSGIIFFNQKRTNNKLISSGYINLFANNYNVGFINGDTVTINGQTNVKLEVKNAHKIVGDNNYFIVLTSDMTLKVFNLNDELKESIEKLKNVVDVVCQDNNIVVLLKNGDVKYFGSDETIKNNIEILKHIERIYSGYQTIICIDYKNSIFSTNTFNGYALLKDNIYFLDISISKNITAIVKENGKVIYKLQNGSFNEVQALSNIENVECGDDFIVALDRDQNVFYESFSHTPINLDTNIKPINIAASNKYFVGLDQINNIYGYGQVDYKQYDNHITFRQLEKIKILETNITENEIEFKIDVDENASMINVRFNNVDYNFNATNIIKLPLKDLVHNTDYQIEFTLLGHDKFLQSDPTTFTYTYKEEEITIISPIFKMDRIEFENYLNSIGIPNESIKSNKSTTLCKSINSNKEVVINYNGINDGATYTKSQISGLKIEYDYCMVN